MRGAREAYQNILLDHPDAPLEALFVFAPIQPADSEAAARALEEEFRDERATVLWDPDQTVAAEFAEMLDVGESPIAWDVYLWYEPGTAWDGAAPAPADWAHQLSGASAPHDQAGNLPAVFRAWTSRYLHGETAQIAPRDPDRRRFTLSPDQIRPLPEVILEAVLQDWAGDPASGLDAPTRRAVSADLLRRTRALRSAYESKVPNAVLLDGQILTLPSTPSCGPDAQSK